MSRSIPCMKVHRAFKFSVNHVSVIKSVNFPCRVVPSDVAKAGGVAITVSAAVPGYGFARFRSCVPNQCFTVSGLLILAFAKCRAADADAQQCSK